MALFFVAVFGTYIGGLLLRSGFEKKIANKVLNRYRNRNKEAQGREKLIEELAKREINYLETAPVSEVAATLEDSVEKANNIMSFGETAVLLSILAAVIITIVVMWFGDGLALSAAIVGIVSAGLVIYVRFLNNSIARRINTRKKNNSLHARVRSRTRSLLIEKSVRIQKERIERNQSIIEGIEEVAGLRAKGVPKEKNKGES